MDRSIRHEVVLQADCHRVLNHSQRLIVTGVAVLMVVLLLPLAASAQEGGQSPTAPSDVEAMNVALPNGATGIQLRWIDTADNEIGFRAVDQRSRQEYDALPNTGPTGSIMALTLPLASGCFRIFAYNNYGTSPLSNMACTPGSLPATAGARGAGATLPGIALVLAIAFMAAGLGLRQRSVERSVAKPIDSDTET